MWIQRTPRNFFVSYVFVCFLLKFCRNLEIKKVKIYATEGQSFKLHCKNETEGEFHKVVWLTNAHSNAKYPAYSYDLNHKTTIHKNFQNRVKRISGTSLEIRDAQKEDGGSWECNIVYNYRDRAKPTKDAQNRRVRLLAVYDVRVISPPIISKVIPEVVAAPRFFQGSAFCDGYSQYPFNLTWIRINGEFSRYVTFSQSEKQMDGTFHKRTHIFFNNMTSGDTGTYLCVAKNFAGQVSREFDVKLQSRPKITNKDFTVQANLNKDGELRCMASGQPKVSYTWVFSHNYERLILKSQDNRDNKFLVSKTKFSYYDGKELSESILTIKNVQRKDWGEYKCIVESKIGYDQKEFQFKGNDVPRAPALLHTEDIEATQITLHWLLDETNGKTKSVIIAHRKLFDYEWDQLEIYEARTSYTVIQLEESTVYEFKIKARNNVGYSKYSSVMSFTTRNTVGEKEVAKAPQESNKIIGNLDLVSLTAIVGSAVVVMTCLFALLCFFLQDSRHKKSKKDRHDSRHLVHLNSTSSNATSSTACLHTISTMNDKGVQHTLLRNFNDFPPVIDDR